MFLLLFIFLIGLNMVSPPIELLCVLMVPGFLNTLLLRTGTPSYVGVFPMEPTFDFTGRIVVVDFAVAAGLAIPVPEELLKMGS
jgi:hypothetical protein